MIACSVSALERAANGRAEGFNHIVTAATQYHVRAAAGRNAVVAAVLRHEAFPSAWQERRGLHAVDQRLDPG